MKKENPKHSENKILKNFRFSKSDYANWEKLAKKENRTMTNLIETIMNKYYNGASKH